MCTLPKYYDHSWQMYACIQHISKNYTHEQEPWLKSTSSLMMNTFCTQWLLFCWLLRCYTCCRLSHASLTKRHFFGSECASNFGLFWVPFPSIFSTCRISRISQSHTSVSMTGFSVLRNTSHQSMIHSIYIMIFLTKM